MRGFEKEEDELDGSMAVIKPSLPSSSKFNLLWEPEDELLKLDPKVLLECGKLELSSSSELDEDDVEE